MHSFKGIDCLRFFAAAMVVATHATFYTTERLDRSFGIWPNGTRGVDIFFVISGFVMVISSQKLLGKKLGWRTFATKRIERIVPMYWLATTCKVAILLFSTGYVLHASFSAAPIVKSYFFIPTRNLDGAVEPILGVGWTLVFEMFFYLTFAVALWSRLNIYLVVVPVLTACSIASLYRPDPYPDWMFYFNPIVLEFLAGMVIAELCLKRIRLNPLASSILLTLSALLLLFSHDNEFGPRIINCGLPAALIVYSVVCLEEIIGPKVPKWIIYLGAASYSIYLFHPLSAPIGTILAKESGISNGYVSAVSCWSIGILTGALVYRFVEPKLRFIRGYKNSSPSAQ